MKAEPIAEMIGRVAVLEQAAGYDGPTWYAVGYTVYDCEGERVALCETAAAAKYLAELRNAYRELEMNWSECRAK